MLSSRNDWNYNAGMDESLNTHRGGGAVYPAHDTVLFRQHTFVLPFLRAFKSFSWGMHIPAGDQQVYL